MPQTSTYTHKRCVPCSSVSNTTHTDKCQRRTRNLYAPSVSVVAPTLRPNDTSPSVIARAKSGKSILRPPMCSVVAHHLCVPRPMLALILLILLNCLNFGNSLSVNNVKSDSFGAAAATVGQQLAQHAKSINTESSIRIRSVVNSTSEVLRITALRLEASGHEIQYEDGVPKVLCKKEFTIRIFGEGITENTVFVFTTEKNEYGGSCLFPATTTFKPEPGSATGTTAIFNVVLPSLSEPFYICAKTENPNSDKSATVTSPLIHQGIDVWTTIYCYDYLLPVWASIIIITLCLCFSALFSGLNLGLMSLDRTELKILRNTGSEKEREYAKKIQPVRDRGNYLLCSILLGNVLVNATFTILLDSLTSGLIAVVCSTLLIVIFGEITPQAICSRHGLAVGAKTIVVTKVIMAITFPLAYPISKILDYILGEEIGNYYNRERLKELVRVTTGINDLDKNEVNIISGALELRKKTVADIMTHIDDVFMLSLEDVLDFETVSEIMKSGYSRIPVYDEDKRNIVTILYIKDLAFVDPDDNTPLKTLCEFYQNPVNFVFEDITLDVMFNQFKDGTFGHMAFVHRVNNDGDGDPFYETIGLVTLEDVIEELIQAEIIDETDVFTDNRTKVRRQRYKMQDFSAFAERRENQNIHISPQMMLATFQYLSTSVDAFKKEQISETILRRLLNQNIVHTIKCKGKDKDDPYLFIYQQGKAVDFFVLILEGRVEVTVGKESLLFESGPFTYFGTQALQQAVIVAESPSMTQIRGSLQSLNMEAKIRQTFVPDYSVRAATDVTYVAIKRALYMTARKATLLEHTRKSGYAETSEFMDEEVAKLLHSLNEDDKPFGGSRKVSTLNGGSNTASPSLNEMSQPSRSIPATALNSLPHQLSPQLPQHQHSPGSNNSADIIDEVSLSSQVTSDPQNIELNAIGDNSGDGDKQDNASIPLLPKASTPANPSIQTSQSK